MKPLRSHISFHIRKNISLSAFTLVELLIATAIIILLTGGVLAGFSGFGTRQNVAQAGQNVENVLRSVQGKAYNGEVSIGSTCISPPASLLGWQVGINNNIVSYSEVCDVSGTPTVYPAVNVTISPPVTIMASPQPILFRTLPKRAEIDSANIICVTDGNNFYQITVERSGNISGIKAASCP